MFFEPEDGAIFILNDQRHLKTQKELVQLIQKYSLLKVLGVELSRNAEDAVIYSRDIGQFVLLRLPVDVSFPQTVRAEVCPTGEYCMLV